jgi:hypothetical protein
MISGEMPANDWPPYPKTWTDLATAALEDVLAGEFRTIPPAGFPCATLPAETLEPISVQTIDELAGALIDIQRDEVSRRPIDLSPYRAPTPKLMILADSSPPCEYLATLRPGHDGTGRLLLIEATEWINRLAPSILAAGIAAAQASDAIRSLGDTLRDIDRIVVNRCWPKHGRFRLSRGWRRHIRRVKADERRAGR